jgi:hypothetical protein
MKKTKALEIVRTPDRVTGGVTAEEKQRLGEHAKLWIARALRTAPIRREFVGFVDGSEHIRLIRTKLERADGKLLTFVHVICPSTAREYYLRVNPDHVNAIDAIASTFHMTGAEYSNFVQAHS